MGISREAQDDYGIESYLRTEAAVEAGLFDEEIVGVEAGKRLVSRDEEVARRRKVARAMLLSEDMAEDPGEPPAADRRGPVPQAWGREGRGRPRRKRGEGERRPHSDAAVG